MAANNNDFNDDNNEHGSDSESLLSAGGSSLDYDSDSAGSQASFRSEAEDLLSVPSMPIAPLRVRMGSKVVPIAPFFQFSTVSPEFFCRGGTFNFSENLERWKQENAKLETACRDLYNNHDLEQEDWGGHRCPRLVQYFKYWVMHVFETHLEELGLNPNSPTEEVFVNSRVLKFGRMPGSGTTVMVLDTGLTQNAKRNLAPLYAFFAQLPEPAEPIDSCLASGPRWALLTWATFQDTFRPRHGEGLNKLRVLARDSDFPELAEFPGLLEHRFDPRIEIMNMDSNHLLDNDDNHSRVQKVLTKPGEPPVRDDAIRTRLKDALAMTAKMARRDLDVARLQRFRDKRQHPDEYANYQFLLPLYLTEGPTFDLALVITTKRLRMEYGDLNNRDDCCYHALTVLTPDMAYTNCRLLGRIRQAWLLSGNQFNRMSGLPRSASSPDQAQHRLNQERERPEPPLQRASPEQSSHRVVVKWKWAMTHDEPAIRRIVTTTIQGVTRVDVKIEKGLAFVHLESGDQVEEALHSRFDNSGFRVVRFEAEREIAPRGWASEQSGPVYRRSNFEDRDRDGASRDRGSRGGDESYGSANRYRGSRGGESYGFANRDRRSSADRDGNWRTQ